ncbi:hypothetical protein MRB53_021710 [Persea americana]|uniref:Uncharacterized protein n=1 Tax=Persea americana TaxID=3435 RepID=A0ACC2L537_PERAE|nr:hypothetical protein MRB53_021710 [Persea americana]
MSDGSSSGQLLLLLPKARRQDKKMIPRDLLRRPRRCGRALFLCKQKSEPSDFSYLDLNRPGLIVATSDLFNSGDMHRHILCSSTTGSEISIWSWFFLYVQVPLLFFSKSHLSTAAEFISLGQPLSGNQTISSKGGIFELGFFTPGNSQNYYIGIWYKQFPEYVVWVANREAPLSNKTSSVLRINQDGNLVLLNQLNRTVWSTNITSIASNSITAELLDTGDLVLRAGSNSSDVIWQSFDYPTDTWLPKGRIGRNKITGERQRMASWKNLEDPAPGLFSLEMDPSGLNQFVLMWNRSKIYWQSGVWTGQYFSSIPGMAADQPYKMSLVETQNRTYATYEFLDNTSMTRNVMDPLGQVQQCTLLLSSQTWSCFWSMPTSRCEIYSYCSSFGICTQPQSTLASCSCLHGFEPGSQKDWDSSIWSGGCKRRTPLQCGRNTSVDAEKDGFFVLHNVQLPVNEQSLTTVESTKDCELYCFNNCSCTAYAYDSSCSVWNGDLINLKQLSVGDVGGRDLYIRLAAIDLQDSGKKKTWVRWVIVADFGLAKLVGREFSRVLTSMRGTVGYLAPEWISGVAITPKADVYSYGMMLFEIISGKRNSEHSGDGGPTFFPTWAAGKIIDGEFLALLDNQLKGNANMEELGRASRVACWCIQENEDDRPSMGLVVQILEGVTEVAAPKTLNEERASPPLRTSLFLWTEEESRDQACPSSYSLTTSTSHGNSSSFLPLLLPSWFFLYVLLPLLFFSKSHPSTAAEILSLGQALSGNQTISSKGGVFELGFFTPGLLDTGNLVLRDGSNSSVDIWQSFDYPTDTWLPKGHLGRNKITGERQRLTSWKNSEDPAPGVFSLEMDPSGINQFVLMWNRSKIYWRSGVWTGRYFSSIPVTAADQPKKMTLAETQNIPVTAADQNLCHL